ncbi:MAG: hypothetical protein M3Q40_10475 [Pseudomonadota bacterium]|nr:hypothetical protein [Pseudomonadota bacterium]
MREASDLPPNSRQYPYHRETQQYGDRWVESGSSLALKVPSAICEREFNVLKPHTPRLGTPAQNGIDPLKIDPRVRE